MTWKNTVQDPAEVKVLEALDGPAITWRTLSAVARQTGLSEPQVAAVLNKYNSTFTRLADVLSITGQPLVGLIEKVG